MDNQAELKPFVEFQHGEGSVGETTQGAALKSERVGSRVSWVGGGNQRPLLKGMVWVPSLTPRSAALPVTPFLPFSDTVQSPVLITTFHLAACEDCDSRGRKVCRLATFAPNVLFVFVV